MDAPYIVEAERFGYPSSEPEFDAPVVSGEMEKACGHINQAVDFLCRAADNCEGSALEKKISEMIEALEDFRCEIRLMQEGVKK